MRLEGHRRQGGRRAGAPSVAARRGGTVGGIAREGGTRWDATAATAAKREGTAARRRCVSLLAPANCRGQPALAEELTELSPTPRKQASRQAGRRASRQTAGIRSPGPRSDSTRVVLCGRLAGWRFAPTDSLPIRLGPVHVGPKKNPGRQMDVRCCFKIKLTATSLTLV